MGKSTMDDETSAGQPPRFALVPHWEWEVLESPVEIVVAQPGSLPGGVKLLAIQRDEDFGLAFRGRGSLESTLEVLGGSQDHPAGVLLPPAAPLTGSCARLQMRGVVHGVRAETGKETWPAPGIPPILDVAGAADSLELYRDQEGTEPAGSLLSLWAINGPTRKDHCLPRRTVWASQTQRCRMRKGSNSTRKAVAGGGGHETNHVTIAIPAGTITVGAVPQGFAPAWTHPGVVEIEAAGGSATMTFMPWDETQPLLDAIGLCIGRRPWLVGQTLFDSDGKIVAASARSPDVVAIRRVCELPSSPAVPVGSPDETEERFSRLVAGLLGVHEQFRLGVVQYMLWLAETLPMGVCFPLYSMALDTLADAWLASPRSASRETSGGVQVKVDRFFAEVQLPIGEPEKAATRTRHRFAHVWPSGLPNMQGLVDTAHAYRTLLHRLILKLAGHDGLYVDYSTHGSPSRMLESPAGGPSGDGTPAAIK